jgi:hypothetical protein
MEDNPSPGDTGINNLESREFSSGEGNGAENANGEDNSGADPFPKFGGSAAGGDIEEQEDSPLGGESIPIPPATDLDDTNDDNDYSGDVNGAATGTTTDSNEPVNKADSPGSSSSVGGTTTTRNLEEDTSPKNDDSALERTSSNSGKLEDEGLSSGSDNSTADGADATGKLGGDSVVQNNNQTFATPGSGASNTSEEGEFSAGGGNTGSVTKADNQKTEVPPAGTGGSPANTWEAGTGGGGANAEWEE